MKMDLNLLQTQNQDLNKDNQRILSSLINSRNILDFLHGFVNSLRNEILGLVLIAACIACPTKLQFEYLELKANDEDHEFLSLRRAYNGDKNVSILEIKKDMIKAIDVIQSKLEINDKLVELLSSTRVALMENAIK